MAEERDSLNRWMPPSSQYADHIYHKLILLVSFDSGKLSADCRRQECPLHSLPGAPLPGFAGLGSFDRKLIMYLVYTSGLIFMRPFQE
jgi:hypothetical protein